MSLSKTIAPLLLTSNKYGKNKNPPIKEGFKKYSKITYVKRSVATMIKDDQMFVYKYYSPKIYANIKGATIVASLSTINLGVLISSLPHVIFSLGTAPL